MLFGLMTICTLAATSSISLSPSFESVNIDNHPDRQARFQMSDEPSFRKKEGSRMISFFFISI